MEYRFSIENFEVTLPVLTPLYFLHYTEMQVRLAGRGVVIPPYRPRIDKYIEASRGGYLLNFVVRTAMGDPVGYSNLYLTNDMHNGELIAEEDTIFVHKDHRNGVGRRFSKAILADLKQRGVVRLNVVALTDLRVAKLWKRMGFREVGVAMTFEFKDDG